MGEVTRREGRDTKRAGEGIGPCVAYIFLVYRREKVTG